MECKYCIKKDNERLCIKDSPDEVKDCHFSNAEKCIYAKKLINKKGTINKELIRESIRNILIALNDDPDRPGLKETPKRVANAYAELFQGMCYTNDDIAEMYDKCFEDCSCGDLVTELNIPIFSTCEHHLILMYNMHVNVGYIPNGKVIGLSKIARVSEMCSRRLQLQERLGQDISEVLSKILDTEDIIVVIEGEHGCMTARGIKKPGTVTRTACLRGAFQDNFSLRQEFYNLMNTKK